MIDEIPYYQDGSWIGDEINHYEAVRDIIKHKNFPLMYSDYITNTFQALAIPFYLLYPTPTSLRITTAFFDVLTIIILYFFVRDLFNEKTAMFSCLLYATLPSAVNFARMGLDASTLPFLLIASLYSFNQWYKTKKMCFLYIGSFLLGFGMSVFLAFIYFCFALIVIVLFSKKMRQEIPLTVVIVFITLGLFPYVVGNLLGDFQTVGFLANNLFVTEEYSYNNALIFQNLFTRIKQFERILNGFFLGSLQPNPPTIPIISLFFLISIIYYLVKRKKNEQFLISLTLLALFVSIFSITYLAERHIFYLSILPCILISKFVIDVSEKKWYLLQFLLALLIVPNLFTLFFYFNTYTGSEFGYKALCEYINEKQPTKVVVTDTGLKPIIRFCYGSEKVKEFTKKDVTEALFYVLKKPDTWYVLYNYPERNEILLSFVNEHPSVSRMKTIYTSNGYEIFYVYGRGRS